MRRFLCIYCGQEVLAPEELVGKRVKCPACGHSILVCREKRREARRSSSQENADTSPKDARYWEGKTNAEIVEQVLTHRPSPEERRRREAIRAISRSLAWYDDLTLFVLSAALILLLLLNSDARRDVLAACFLPRAGIYVALAVLGMALSFLNIFVRRKKCEAEKRMMLLFAVLAVAGTGVYSAYVTWKTNPSWLMIFPAWNVLSGGVLLLEFCEGLITTDSIVEQRPSLRQIVLAATSITVLLLTCQYALKLHWATTYSIAVCYTMSLLSTVQDLFGQRPGHDAKSGADL
jgi:DNA-directed RNA polymerase subunit RPC12/RpoP